MQNRRLILTVVFSLFIGQVAFADMAWENDVLTLQTKANDTEAKTVYHFQNTGSKIIHIVDVTTSCGCTQAAASKNVFAPGEKGEINVIFHLDIAADTKDRQIFIKTDDGSSSKTLTLKIHVAELIHFDPRRLVWNQEEARDPKTIQAQVLSDEPVSEIHLSSSSGAIKVDSEPLKGNGKYEIKVVPSLGTTPASAWIRVEAKLKSGTTKVAMFFVNVQ